MQDVFDEDDLDLKQMYTTKKWSEIEDDMKDTIVKRIKNNLISRKLEVPSEKIIINRAKGFYSSRRGVEVTKLDPDKAKRRQFEVKKNRLTFVRVFNKNDIHLTYQRLPVIATVGFNRDKI